MLSCQCLVSFRCVLCAFQVRGLFAVQHAKALQSTEGRGESFPDRYNTPVKHQPPAPVQGRDTALPRPAMAYPSLTGQRLAQPSSGSCAALHLRDHCPSLARLRHTQAGHLRTCRRMGLCSRHHRRRQHVAASVLSRGEAHSRAWFPAALGFLAARPHASRYYRAASHLLPFNFSLGATNSNIALFCMILVALSGVAGRYIYTRVHRGLSAVRFDLNTLLANSSRLLARSARTPAVATPSSPGRWRTSRRWQSPPRGPRDRPQDCGDAPVPRIVRAQQHDAGCAFDHRAQCRSARLEPRRKERTSRACPSACERVPVFRQPGLAAALLGTHVLALAYSACPAFFRLAREWRNTCCSGAPLLRTVRG